VLAMANLTIWWSWGTDSREPATEVVVETPAPLPRVAYLALREAAGRDAASRDARRS
jgi:hypothetical protein